MAELPKLFAFIPIVFAALFHVVNPIGSSVLLLNFTPEVTKKDRKVLARKIAINSLGIMTVVLFLGVYVLRIFGISIPVVQICGGLMIAVMGWKALNSDDEELIQENKQDHLDRRMKYQDKEFYPFTFPFTIGPGTIAVTLTISAESSQKNLFDSLYHFLGAMIAMVLIALTIYVCYGYADILLNKMRGNLRKVLMRIFSFIMLCIGGEIVLGGIEAALRNYSNITP